MLLSINLLLRNGSPVVSESLADKEIMYLLSAYSQCLVLEDKSPTAGVRGIAAGTGTCGH